MKKAKKIGVYLITNKETNEIYVGSSKNIERRWYSHKYDSKNAIYPNNKLHNDMRTLGENAFSFEIIEECEEKDLAEREQFYINQLNPAYNHNKAFCGIDVKQAENYNEYHRLYLKTQKEYNEKHREACAKWNAEHKNYFKALRNSKKQARREE